ncbi:hypothetical protein TRICI_004310 [Trichomonascus ciferrii]|uniref:Uncharacterized protein n=1 Tax=Trichomonascus ciferrii TaxID=44093 RepID=A0A642V0P4_9ASCO|nr:hypothetical protein TRICI_004310 [Trichomonascus ciferrii]
MQFKNILFTTVAALATFAAAEESQNDGGFGQILSKLVDIFQDVSDNGGESLTDAANEALEDLKPEIAKLVQDITGAI